MVKKVKKYLKFVVCSALILSLIAPSYAALSASDGSAFVTKAEFDSALADFNARLTTFEAGINSKIDSQVTSYLDRNGIWNGSEQEYWDFSTDPLFDTVRATLSTKTGDQWWVTRLPSVYGANEFSYWSPWIGAAQTAMIPMIKNVTKSGLLAYNIPIIWFQANTPSSGHDYMLTTVQTNMINIDFNPDQTASYVSVNLVNFNNNYNDPISGFYDKNMYVGVAYYCKAISMADCDYFSVPYTAAGSQSLMDYDCSLLKVQTASTSEDSKIKLDVSSGVLDLGDIFATKTNNSWKVDNETSTNATLYFSRSRQQYAKNFIMGNACWTGSERAGTLKWSFTSSFNGSNATLLSGYTFVKKGQPWFVCPGAGCGMIWTSKDKPISSAFVRTSGAKLKLSVY